MEMKISVVIPVYNSEKYLDQCVLSLINQTLKEVEFIFVDDGSTDSSVKILEKYQKDDARIKIIKQQNQFAGVARNNGMKEATGKYLMFLDSDDFFELNMLECLYNIAESNQTEIVIFGHNIFDDIQQRTVRHIVPQKVDNGIFAPISDCDNLFDICWGVPWNKFLLRSFIKDSGIQYQEIRHSNDEYFNRMILTQAERVLCIRNIYVYYRVNVEGSLQKKRKDGTSKDCQCALLAWMRIKSELIYRNLFTGKIKNASYSYMQSEIQKSIKYAKSVDQFLQIYNFIKEHLIPDLYESIEDISTESLGFKILNSESPEEFLFSEMQELNNKMQEEFIPRSSKSFIIGNAILSVPRAFKNFIRRK